MNPKTGRQKGFTLIELMVVVALIGLLVGVALPQFRHAQDKARVAVLKTNLFLLRQTLDQYFADKGYWPGDLETLVSEKYLRKLPEDPFTGKPDWEQVPADSETNVDPNQPAGIWDVRSSAKGAIPDGTPFNEL